jgi:hypothetical protein
MRRCGIQVIALVAVALAGCGSGGNSTAAKSTAGRHAGGHMSIAAMNGQSPPYLPPGPRPAVSFTTPHDGQVLGSTFTARVALHNFTIDPRSVGHAPAPGRGHLHFKLDGGKFDYPQYAGADGIVGKQLGVSGVYSPALAPLITYSHIPPGTHTLEVDLANNNHTVLGIDKTVRFTVR